MGSGRPVGGGHAARRIPENAEGQGAGPQRGMETALGSGKRACAAPALPGADALRDRSLPLLPQEEET